MFTKLFYNKRSQSAFTRLSKAVDYSFPSLKLTLMRVISLNVVKVVKKELLLLRHVCMNELVHKVKSHAHTRKLLRITNTP